MAKFEIFQGKDDRFYFRLKAGNGEIVLQSQGYTSVHGARTGVESVITNAPLRERFELATSSNNEPYFNLRAANGQVIGRSEMYSSRSARDHGIDAVQRAAAEAEIVEL